MLKVGAKRRRTKNELLQEREEEQKKEDDIQEKLGNYELMMSRITQLES